METSSSSSSSPSSTPIPLPMAPPAGQPSVGLSKMQQEPTAAPDGPPIEAAVAASNKSTASSSSSSSSRAIPIPQSRDSIYLRREKDVAPVNPVSRTDSTDSYARDFRSRRTDTSWSSFTHSSTITDITEPPSPDAENFDDPILFEEQYASSPRPFGNPGRTVTFYQDNCRPAPYSSSPDNNPLPRHSGILRLQDRSSSPRRGIPRSSTGLNPARPSSVARRGSNQWPAPLAYRPRLSRHTIQESAEDTRELPTPTEPSEPVIRFEEPSETTMIRQIEQVATVEDVGLSSLSVEDTPTTETVSEEMSDVSDSTGDIGTPTSSASGSKPDDQIVQETCDHVLRNVFGVDLQDLGATDAASAAYDSVHYCLDELWHLVPAENTASQSSPPLREVANYGNTGGGHAPIRPGNGGEASSFQVRSGSGGGSGGQKRPNGEGDQGDQGKQNGNGGGKRPGDRDNGGGGKRPKVAAEEPTDDQKLSCPFRKRNAAKFNVRDHQSCAVQSFPDISQLKRHVKNFHKQRTVSLFACPRCKKDMQTKEGVEYHLAVPNESICTPQEAPPVHNPEDGITSRIEDVLNGRKANTKVDTWEYLWRTLFPEDLSIPDSHFVPPVELEEVQCRFQNSMDDLEFRIRTAMEQNANDFDQSLEDRITQIAESCSGYIKHVLEQSRFQADNAPGRPRRNRSHGHGQNPKSTSKGKSPETQGSGSGSGSSSQHPMTPENSQPRAIPKKEGHDPSPNESKLSSSFETANSDGSWVHTQPGDQEAINTLSRQTFDQYPGLNIDTNDTFHTEIGDVPLSAATTGPAASPDHVISPQIGHGNTTPVIPPPQAHLRSMFGNGFQVPFNSGQGQPLVPNVLDGQFHNRTDSAISGLDATSATYFRPSPAIANANNMGVFHAAPSAFHGMSAAMGYGGPPAHGQMHPQQLQQMQQHHQQHRMQVRFRQAQAAGQHQQVATTVTGGTIDPRMISFGVAPPMGMGNNGANSGQLYNSFSPGGSDGTN
ncbi:hypothetical protein V8F33_003420 [Rhypophila sp. PSN 637]